jgi:ATP-binding cassette subfamily B protein
VTATWYVSVLNERLSRRFRDRIAIAMESHIARLQATVATVEHQERPDYLDRLAVLRDTSFTLDHLFQSLLSNLALVLRLAVTALLLASIHPALALLLLAGAPAILTSLWRPGIERATEESVAVHERLARHLFLVGTTAGPAKEVRVTGIGASLRQRRADARERYRAPVAAVRWRSAMWSSLAWAVFGIAYVLGIAWVARGLDRSVGDIVLVVVAGQRLSAYIAQSVAELGFLRGVWLDSSLRLTWLEDYAAALEERATTTPPDRIVDGISFEHVSFRYPGTERNALDDIDLTLPAGAVVAIVGENGAGKSTLVKLLSGMYHPTSGRVTVDGVDLATMSSAAWRRRLAGAFQDFFRFELVARQSVGVGDEPRVDDEPAVVGAVDRAGAMDVVERLPAGLATQLGPTWDDGVEVSFGQWQKVALARGFMREEPLVLVLDEPTAALDAETEHALFERYAGAVRDANGNGRITVLVSHRFSTVRMADLIVVLDGSRVVEVGRHDQLLAKGGQYAELFAIQAGAYR